MKGQTEALKVLTKALKDLSQGPERPQKFLEESCGFLVNLCASQLYKNLTGYQLIVSGNCNWRVHEFRSLLVSNCLVIIVHRREHAFGGYKLGAVC